MKNCIYKISSYKTGRIYVGSSLDPIKRKSLHFRQLANGGHYNSKLQRHYNKYGSSDLYFEILESDISRILLLEREQYYIDCLNPFFNICRIAGNALGRTHSKKTKEKIRTSLIGVKHSNERRFNISMATKGKPKKDFSKNHKENMSKSFRGKKKNNPHVRKPILQYSDGVLIKEYASIKEASIEMETSTANIINSAKHGKYKAKGYEWRYKEDTPFNIT